jgi:hypothetical protein
MVSSLLAGIPFSSLSVEDGMPWVLTRGERLRRNRLQGGRLHLGTVAGIDLEKVAGMRLNPHSPKVVDP